MKYLFFEPLEENVHETLDIITAIVRSINEKLKEKDQGLSIQHLRGDGDRKFAQ
jgi:FtsZ-binding cell division protein ZapB